MNMTRSALAVLWLAMVVPAQAGGQPPTSKAEYEAIVAEWTAAKKAATLAQSALVASEAYQAAQKAKDTAKLTELRATVKQPDGKAYGARAIELAAKYPGDEGLPFLTFLCTKVYDKASVALAVDSLLEHHVKSAGITDILENAMALSSLAGKEQAEKLLSRVIAENPHKLPKAWASYWQASTIQRDKTATAEMKAKAEQMLAEAEQLAAGSLLADRIAAPRFIKENLQIGMTAPNIVGEDLDGAAFELKDYLGKVVVLDFWGFW